MPDPLDITRFASRRPVFQPPKNATALEAMAPRPKDTTPAPSVVARTEASGHVDLAVLISASQTMAKQNAKAIEKKPRQARTPKGEVAQAAPAKEAAPKYAPEDVLSDADFIKQTRDIDIRTPRAQALFWANGGEHHMIPGMTFAQAWDNLRRSIVASLSRQRWAR